MSDSSLLTVNEVARRFAVSPDAVRHWAKTGVLPVKIRVGTLGERLFALEDVERLEAQRRPRRRVQTA